MGSETNQKDDRELLITLNIKFDMMQQILQKQDLSIAKLIDSINQKADKNELKTVESRIEKLEDTARDASTRKTIFGELSDLGFKSWAAIIGLAVFIYNILKST